MTPDINIERDDLSVGDTFTAIPTDMNSDNHKDPLTRLNGDLCFLSFPDDIDPQWGEPYRARLVDYQEDDGIWNAVVVNQVGGEEDG